MVNENITKAKRRIKRFIKTGKPVARVRKVDTNVYEYNLKHHLASLYFKSDILGRLRQII